MSKYDDCYKALTENKYLQDFCFNHFYRDNVPAVFKYPFLLFKNTGTIPILHADNNVVHVRHLMRVTITDKINDFKDCEDAIYSALSASNCTYVRTNYVYDAEYKEYSLVCDYYLYEMKKG